MANHGEAATATDAEAKAEYVDFSQATESIYESFEEPAGAQQQQQHQQQTNSSDRFFPVKLHYMLGDIATDGLESIVSWQPHGRCFVVRKPLEFVEAILPKWFSQTRYASFQRQLNLYGFKRITAGLDKGAYYHEFFLRGKLFLSRRIQRNRVKGTGARKPGSPKTEPNFYAMPHLPQLPSSQHHPNHHQQQQDSNATPPHASTPQVDLHGCLDVAVRLGLNHQDHINLNSNTNRLLGGTIRGTTTMGFGNTTGSASATTFPSSFFPSSSTMDHNIAALDIRHQLAPLNGTTLFTPSSNNNNFSHGSILNSPSLSALQMASVRVRVIQKAMDDAAFANNNSSCNTNHPSSLVMGGCNNNNFDNEATTTLDRAYLAEQLLRQQQQQQQMLLKQRSQNAANSEARLAALRQFYLGGL